MKLGTIKTVVKEELQKQESLPKWIDPLLIPLNQFISQVGSALKGNLTLEDNFFCKTKKLEFKSGVSIAVNPDTLNKITGCLCVDVGGATLQGFRWRALDSGLIEVTVTHDGGDARMCKLIFFMG